MRPVPFFQHRCDTVTWHKATTYRAPCIMFGYVVDSDSCICPTCRAATLCTIEIIYLTEVGKHKILDTLTRPIADFKHTCEHDDTFWMKAKHIANSHANMFGTAGPFYKRILKTHKTVDN